MITDYHYEQSKSKYMETLMKFNRKFSIALAAMLVLPVSFVMAQINFNNLHVKDIEVEDIEAILGISDDTDAIDGLAVDAAGRLFVLHRDNDADETLLLFDPTDNTGAVIADVNDFAAALGAGYVPSLMTFVAGMAVNGSGTLIYLADNSFEDEDVFVKTLFEVDYSDPDNVVISLVVRGEDDLDDLEDFALMPNGVIVGAREDSSGVGVIDPTDAVPSWTELVSQSDFQAILGTTDEAPPEAIGVNPTNGDVWVFVHDVYELFRIEDLGGAGQTITRVQPPNWPTSPAADLHGLEVDAAGNVYGLDVANEAIVVYDGTNGFVFPLDDIFEELDHDDRDGDHDLEITFWRGLAAYQTSAETSVLYLAIADVGNDEAIIVLEFGGDPSSVQDWTLY